MKIDWTESSVTDLEYIKNYIGKDSEIYAIEFTEKIIISVESLNEFPMRGRIVPEFKKKYVRELLFYNYRIIYKIEDCRIIILTIIHGSRNLRRTDKKSWEII